ncbi:MAG: hypothetical protein JWQ96_3491 [Segetibacter sp.]|nr:hypothetical protein [Segetibacter sp.]
MFVPLIFLVIVLFFVVMFMVINARKKDKGNRRGA